MVKRRGSDLNGRGARDHELEGVGGPGDSADSDDGKLRECPRDFPDHAESDRLDGRAAQGADVVGQDRPSSPPVYY